MNKASCHVDIAPVQPQGLRVANPAKSLNGDERKNTVAGSVQKLVALLRRQNPGGFRRNAQLVNMPSIEAADVYS